MTQRSKRKLFYLFGLVYSTVVIAVGSVCISLAEMAVVAIVATLYCGVSFLAAIGGAVTNDTVLGAIGGVIIAGMAYGIVTAVVPMLAGAASISAFPVLILMAASVLPLLAVGYIGFTLYEDLRIGVSHSSLDFYNCNLHNYGVLKALISPFIFLSTAACYSFEEKYQINYLAQRKKEELINTSIDTINDNYQLIINTPIFPKGISDIIAQYLYGELVLVFNRYFPAFPASVWKDEITITREEGRNFIFNYLQSHGFIRRKLEFVEDEKKPDLKKDKYTTRIFPELCCLEIKDQKDQNDPEDKKYARVYSIKSDASPEGILAGVLLEENDKPLTADELKKIADRVKRSEDDILEILSVRGVNCFFKAPVGPTSPTSLWNLSKPYYFGIK